MNNDTTQWECVFKGPMTDIQKARIKKTISNGYDKKAVILECAKEFGWFLADGQISGLSREVAFEAAKKHFSEYGQAMIDFSEIVTIEMVAKGGT